MSFVAVEKINARRMQSRLDAAAHQPREFRQESDFSRLRLIAQNLFLIVLLAEKNVGPINR